MAYYFCEMLPPKVDTAGPAAHKLSSGVHTEDNIDDVEHLVLSQKDGPGTRRIVC